METQNKTEGKTSTESIGVTEMQLNKVSMPCTFEPQFGRCVWGWYEKYKGYLCSICGKEVIRIEQLKEAEN